MRINNGLLRADGSFNSKYVNVHVSLAYQLDREGEYACEVTDAMGRRRTVAVKVGSESLPSQGDIDCAALFKTEAPMDSVEVRASGYVLVDSGFGDGRFAVRIISEEAVVFDSSAIHGGAIVIVSPLVPGVYTVQDEIGGASAELEVKELAQLVARADEAELVAFYERLHEQGPVSVSLTSEGFNPRRIELIADQPMTVTGTGPMRIVGTRAQRAT
jgi:hypothetical protein